MADLALAVVGAVDVCIRLDIFLLVYKSKTYIPYRSAQEIKEICRRFKAHDREIDEKTVLVEAVWVRIEIQMRFLSKISSTLDEELTKSQLSLLRILEGKLLQAITQLRIESSGNEINERSPKQKIADYLKKWKWAIKDSLGGLVIELETWHRRFDPTWYLMILNSNQMLDRELQNAKDGEAVNGQDKRLRNQQNPLTNMLNLRLASRADYRAKLYTDWAKLGHPEEIPIMFSSARAVVRRDNGPDSPTRLYVVEAVMTPDGCQTPLIISQGSPDISQIKADVQSLAGKLHQVDPDTFSLLKCKVIIYNREPATNAVNGIELLYNTPQNSSAPTSLRALLLDSSLVPSLNSIVRVAKQLVRSVSFVHTSSFVHKNIRPENILVFPDEVSSLGMSFLVGFNQFRPLIQQTYMLGDTAWHRNLYRHPERQGTNVVNRYVMQHDIYSLGVCLLEIGLWQSFVHYPGLNPSAVPIAPVTSEIQICDRDFDDLTARLCVKEQLVDMARRKLPSRVGDVYSEVVVACLQCLEPGNEIFGDRNQQDKDGTLIGIRFIERILARINSISV